MVFSPLLAISINRIFEKSKFQAYYAETDKILPKIMSKLNLQKIDLITEKKWPNYYLYKCTCIGLLQIEFPGLPLISFAMFL